MRTAPLAILTVLLFTACAPTQTPGQQVNALITTLGTTCKSVCGGGSAESRVLVPPNTALSATQDGICVQLDRKLFCARCGDCTVNATTLLTTTGYENVTCRFTGGESVSVQCDAS